MAAIVVGSEGHKPEDKRYTRATAMAMDGTRDHRGSRAFVNGVRDHCGDGVPLSIRIP